MKEEKTLAYHAYDNRLHLFLSCDNLDTMELSKTMGLNQVIRGSD